MIKSLFVNHYGVEPRSIERLAASGSNRIYYRIISQDGESCIGTEGTSVAENRAFISISRHFEACGLPVPTVIAVSEDEMCYLQSDLGGELLIDCADDEVRFKTMEILPRIQFEGGSSLDYSVCFPQESFDSRNVRFDLNYFKYCFLKLTEIEFDEIVLEEEFCRLEHSLLSVPCCGFMYRDFQARNVMVVDSQPYFIDFQGGRRGPFYYDVASFVWQARAAYSPQMKQSLLDCYYNALQSYYPIDREQFDRELKVFVLFRVLQTLGAYGYRGIFQRKPHFINSIVPALANMLEILEDMDYPYMKSLAMRLQHFFDKSVSGKESPLVVEVGSFSFKNGLPEDSSGNGGGYIFDCRGLNNPGRYPEYCYLTGMDSEVENFLESDGGVTRFLSTIYPLADMHVANYIERGFTHLQFYFGCTGGQHRSVYCAEHLAKYIFSKFGVRVELNHREQGINKVLNNS